MHDSSVRRLHSRISGGTLFLRALRSRFSTANHKATPEPESVSDSARFWLVNAAAGREADSFQWQGIRLVIVTSFS